MLSKTRTIILHTVPFRENSLVVHAYTELYGRQSFIVNSVKGKKAKFHINLFQPLYLHEIDMYYKPNQNLHRLKDIQHIAYSGIPVDIHKSSICMFLAEVLYKTLREEEHNKDLFGFLFSSFQILDILEENTQVFHLSFLLEYTRFLGFYPTNNYSKSNPVFDIKNGRFLASPPPHPLYAPANQGEYINLLLAHTTGYQNLPKIPRVMKQQILDTFLEYYYYHLDGIGKIKSITILKDIFK